MCSLDVRDQVSYPYRTTGKIIVLRILIFVLLDTWQEDKKIWNGMIANIPLIGLFLILHEFNFDLLVLFPNIEFCRNSVASV
jgi:hypothetical protein